MGDGAGDQGLLLGRDRLAGLHGGAEPTVEIFAPLADQGAPELQHAGIGDGDVFAGGQPELVNALDEQAIGVLGMVEDPPLVGLDDLGHGLQGRAHGGLAADRRVEAAGIVPDDVVGEVDEHALDVLVMPGFDNGHLDGVEGRHRLFLG